METDPTKPNVKSVSASQSLEIQIGDVDIIDVDVDDQAKTQALGALNAAAAAKALAAADAKAAAPAPNANATSEIDVGDVLEVMAKPQAPRPSTKAIAAAPASVKPAPAKPPPPSDLVVSGVVVPPPPSAPQMALPSVMVSANSTVEIRPGDVLEEIVVEPAPTSVKAPVQVQTAPIPVAPASNSDIAKTHVLPPTPRQPLAQFSVEETVPPGRFSIDEEVAPLTSDTSEIPLDRIAGMPLWLQIKDKPQLMVVGGAVAACLLIGALALGIHLHGSSSDDTANVKAAAAGAIGPTMHKEDPSAAIPPPPAQPDVQTVSIDDLKRDHGPAASTVESHPWTPSAEPVAHHSHGHAHHTEAASAPAGDPAPKTHASKRQGFGLIRTWIAARGEPIAVDGKVLGVAPSPVRVSCGPHTVAIGREIVKADVPCDGAITVGSPDHKK